MTTRGLCHEPNETMAIPGPYQKLHLTSCEKYHEI